jgi:GntR family transcriptional regulator
VARKLALDPGAPITILRRLLKLGDEPVVFDEIYLSSELFPDLTLEVVRAGESLYGLFESRYGVCMVRADERLRAVPADRVSAELLQSCRGEPAAAGRARDLHLWPEAGGMAPGLLLDTQSSLSQ